MTRKIQIYIGNLIKVNKDQINHEELYGIKAKFTNSNPQYWMIKNSRSSNPYAVSQQVEVPEFIKNYFENDTAIAIPRGSGSWMRTYLQQQPDTSVELIDNRIELPKIDIEMNFGAKCANGKIFQNFYPYQAEAIQRLSRNQQGIFEAGCGGGKTLLGIGLISAIKQPTLILVHTGDLAKQWADEMREKTRGDFSLGTYGLGQLEICDITIATIQKLSRLEAYEKYMFLSKFGCVILDECHHCPADTFSDVMNYSPSKYRYGLTATPNRSDGLAFLMYDTISDYVYRADESQVVSAGVRTSPPKVTMIRTGYTDQKVYTMNTRAYAINKLCSNQMRNDLIIINILKDWKDGRFPLVISQRIDQCKLLEEKLTANGMNCGILIGEINASVRKEIIENSRKRLIDVIIGTSVADEGLDIPQLDTLHIASPHSNDSRLEQQCGRIRRSCEGKKEPEIRDYIDIGNYFDRMTSKRINFYRRSGYEIRK